MKTLIAIACQGGGSQTAFTAGDRDYYIPERQARAFLEVRTMGAREKRHG